jgi:HEAT repeat protein
MLAAEALGAIGGEKASRALAAAVCRRSSDPRFQSPVLALSEEAVRNSAAYQLGHLGDPASVEPLLEALVRSHLIGAGEALVRFREPRAIPLLVECLSDSFARERAATAILEFGREAIGALIAALHSVEFNHGLETPRSVERRAAAARLLGETKARGAETALRESLDDPILEVRHRAAIALAQVAPETSVPERVRVLIDGLGDAALSDEYEDALLVASGHALPPLVEAVSAEARATSGSGAWVPSRRLRAMARAIARMGNLGQAALGALATHSNPLVRGLAVGHLARTRAPMAESVIAQALRDCDPRVRRTAAGYAKRMGLEVRASNVAHLAHRIRRVWRLRLTRLLERLGRG